MRGTREMDDAHQALHLSVSGFCVLIFKKKIILFIILQFVQSCIMFFTCTTEHSDSNGSKETVNVPGEGIVWFITREYDGNNYLKQYTWWSSQ